MEKAAKEIKEFNKIKNESFRDLIQLGYQEADLNKSFADNNILEGQTNKLKDFIWHSYQALLFENSKDFEMQSRIHWSMAVYSFKFEKGKNLDQLKSLSHLAKLNYFEAIDLGSDIESGVIIISGKCEICQKDKDKIFSVKELRQNSVIPHLNCNCTGIGCTCMYGYKALRDSKGRLIFKDFEYKKSSKKDDKLMREGAKSILNLFSLFKKK